MTDTPSEIWLDPKRMVASTSQPSPAWRDIYTDRYIRDDIAAEEIGILRARIEDLQAEGAALRREIAKGPRNV